jgi:hypothetical protein
MSTPSSSSSTANLNAGMRCVKYMLFLINFMFMVAAILLISIGTTIQSIFGTLEIYVDDHFLSPPALVVATGIILLIVAIFGCVGAVKESTAMINIYGLLLGVIFILEIAAAISAFALQPQVEDMLERTMRDSIVNYREHPNVQKSVNFIQTQLQCCGVIGPQDWDDLPERIDIESDTVYVPSSCCAEFAPSFTGDLSNCTLYFENGCLNRMNFVISQSTVLIATGALAVAFVQLLGVICAFMLAKTIRRTKSLRAARRYQLQQSLVGAFNEKTNYGFKDPAYTQLDNKDKSVEPITYIPTSPSVN